MTDSVNQMDHGEMTVVGTLNLLRPGLVNMFYFKGLCTPNELLTI